MLQQITPAFYTRLLLARYRKTALDLGHRNKAISHTLLKGKIL